MKVDAQKMKEAAEQLSKMLPGKGFALIVFDFNAGTQMSNYISNASREGMEQALEEILNRWKEQKDFLTPNAN